MKKHHLKVRTKGLISRLWKTINDYLRWRQHSPYLCKHDMLAFSGEPRVPDTDSNLEDWQLSPGSPASDISFNPTKEQQEGNMTLHTELHNYMKLLTRQQGRQGERARGRGSSWNADGVSAAREPREEPSRFTAAGTIITDKNYLLKN